MNPLPPSSTYACSGFDACRYSRRHALKVGGLGLLGLNLPGLLRAEEKARRQNTLRPRIRSVIFLFQYGGPSHVDMFDMKPGAPEAIRGPYRPMASSADGIQVNERLERTARIMDRVTLIRSVHHTMNNHNSAGYYALTGHAPAVDDQRLRDSLELFPGYGSVVDRFLPRDPEVPTYVSYPYVICSRRLVELDAEGYAIGGLSVGEPRALSMEMTEASVPHLPAERPRYVMGVGTPEELAEYVARGVDMMDCVMPSRNARNGCLFTANGKLIIKHARYKEDGRPVDESCRCYTCAHYSRAYLRHLFMSGEIVYSTLATLHNLYRYLDIMRTIRQAIVLGTFPRFLDSVRSQPVEEPS